MIEYKKNCPDKEFEKQTDPSQHYGEYLFGIRIYNKSKLSQTHGFEKESIDDYFTSLQIISNSILLKRYKIRAKRSVCGYYKLYCEEIISKEQYEKIEEIREKRNIIHYDGYESNFIDDKEVDKLITFCESLFEELKKIYEEL